jgi:TRAP-type uncharacterized transport system substrate-binding protein
LCLSPVPAACRRCAICCFLRGIDMAIVPSNVLAHARANEAMGGGLAQRVAYVTRLFAEEVHLLVGTGVASIEDLRGKQIAVPPTTARRNSPRKICSAG